MANLRVPSTELVEPMRWERQAGEESWEYALFCAYRDMPRGERTLVGAWRSLEGEMSGLPPERVLTASEKWDWPLRVAEWDVYCEQKESQRKGKLAEEQEGYELEMSRALFAKAYTMLQFPVMTKEEIKSPDGTTIINMYPTNWKPSDVARLLETASKLGRLASGMETERAHVTVSQVLDALPDSVRRQLLPVLAELLTEGE